MNAARLLQALADGDVRFIVFGEIAPVRLLSIETILEIERASPRPKDQAVVPLLEAVLRRRSG